LVVENFGAYHRSVADTVARFAGFVASISATGCWSISAIPRPMRMIDAICRDGAVEANGSQRQRPTLI